jgi:fucose permease
MPIRTPTLIAVLLCDLAMMALAISINLLPVFLTTLSHDLGGERGLSDEQLGRIGASIFIGLVIGIIATGPLADRWGARPFAVGGNLLIVAGLAILSLAKTYSVVLVASLVMGAGAGALDMILSPIVSTLQPRRRTVAMNLLHAFYCIGAVVTILASSIALKHGVGWRAVAAGLIGLPLVVGICFAVIEIPPLIAAGMDRTRMRSLIRQPVFMAALGAIFLGGATELGIVYWLPAFAEKTLAYPKFTASQAALGFSIGMAIGRLGIAALPATVKPIPLMLGCCVASAILFPIGSFAPWNGVALWACILVGVTGSSLWPSTLAVAADRFPHGGATMFGVLAATGNAGGILMPWIVGVVADHANMRWGLATSTLCPALMIVLLLYLRRHHAPPAPAPAL